MADTRDRVFATTVYPDSAPEGWMDIVNGWHVPAFISPLHDKDVNPDGSPKKPHWHLMLIFEGKKNFENQVKPMFDEVGAVGREFIASARGYARYLTHLDNPEKAQYDKADVIAFGGLSYSLYCQSSADEKVMMKDMQDFIRKQVIISFAEFADYCALHNEEWYNLLTDKKTYYFTKYINSMEYSLRHQLYRDKIDVETGEILDGGETDEDGAN